MVLIFHSFVILTILKMCNCQGEKGEKQSGDYKVKIISMAFCEERNDKGQMGYRYTRMSKNNRTHTCVSGVYSLPYGLNDGMQQSTEIFSKGSTGGWKRFLTIKHKKACSDKIKVFPEWFDLLKLERSCPVPPGNYSFTCHDITGWKFSKAAVMTYGEFRSKVNFYYKKENIGCTDFIAEIVPVSSN